MHISCRAFATHELAELRAIIAELKEFKCLLKDIDIQESHLEPLIATEQQPDHICARYTNKLSGKGMFMVGGSILALASFYYNWQSYQLMVEQSD